MGGRKGNVRGESSEERGGEVEEERTRAESGKTLD